MTKFVSLLFIMSFLFIHWTKAQPLAEINLITSQLQIQAGQVQEIELSILLPKNFHAYKDQFKVVSVDPENFKMGQVSIAPEVEFYDKHFKVNKKGLFEKGQIKIQVEAPEKITATPTQLEFKLRYQICSEQVCYLPQTTIFKIPITTSQIKASAGDSSSTGLFSLGTIENQLSKNFLLTYLFVFIAGILTSFTPCIFPMIPITLSILGHDSQNKSRLQNFSRSLFYVLGIAITYSSLGVAAALTGSFFGQALANKYVVLALIILFVLMALSMWGAFELQVPSFIRNRFGTGKSSGYFGAFIMGLVAGLVASPCVGPVLVSILSFVSTTQSVSLGFSLLFTYAIGLGLIFIAIGTFSELIKKLPRSGPWMEFIKFSLGLLMIIAALYYLKFIISIHSWILISSLTFMAISGWQGAFNFQRKHPFRQSLFIIVFITSLILTLLTIFKKESVVSIFDKTADASMITTVAWQPYSKEALQKAASEGSPVIIDFFAEWCGACHELEDKTYTQPEFIELSKQFTLLKVDATEDKPEVQKIIDEYQIKGLPTVLFINKKGELLSELTFTQFLEWSELKPKMQKALE